MNNIIRKAKNTLTLFVCLVFSMFLVLAFSNNSNERVSAHLTKTQTMYNSDHSYSFIYTRIDNRPNRMGLYAADIPVFSEKPAGPCPSGNSGQDPSLHSYDDGSQMDLSNTYCKNLATGEYSRNPYVFYSNYTGSNPVITANTLAGDEKKAINTNVYIFGFSQINYFGGNFNYLQPKATFPNFTRNTANSLYPPALYKYNGSFESLNIGLNFGIDAAYYYNDDADLYGGLYSDDSDVGHITSTTNLAEGVYFIAGGWKNYNLNFFGNESSLDDSVMFGWQSTFVYDVTPPNVSFSPTSNNAYARQSVSVYANGGNSPIYRMQYAWANYSWSSIPDSSWIDVDLSTYAPSFHINSVSKTISSGSVLSGMRYLHVKVEDYAGNVTRTASGAYYIDNTLPNVSLFASPTSSSQTLTSPSNYVNSMKIEVNTYDGHSGIDPLYTEYCVSENSGSCTSGEWVTYNFVNDAHTVNEFTIGINLNGTRYLLLKNIRDKAGNLVSAMPPMVYSQGGSQSAGSNADWVYYIVRFDNTPPEITVSIDDETYFNNNVSVKLTRSDADSGLPTTNSYQYCYSTSYTSCSSSWSTYTSGSNFTLNKPSGTYNSETRYLLVKQINDNATIPSVGLTYNNLITGSTYTSGSLTWHYIKLMFDTAVPGGTITPVTNSPTGETMLVFNIVWSESITGFTKEDVTTTNVKPLSQNGVSVSSDSGTTMQITVLSSIANGSSGNTCISISAGKVVDRAGNGNASVSQKCVTVNRVGPTGTLTRNGPAVTAKTTLTFNIAWSETITGFTTGDVTPTNGTVTKVSASSGNSMTITVSSSITSGVGDTCVSIGANKVYRQGTSIMNSAVQKVCTTVDKRTPTAVITPVENTVGRTVGIEFEIEWNKPIYGLEEDKLTLRAWNPANMAFVEGISSSSGTFMTITTGNYMPTLGREAVCMSIEAGKIFDDDNNSNAAVAEKCVWIDTDSPKVTSPTGNSSGTTTKQNYEVAIEWSEPINLSTFTTDDIVVTNGEITYINPLDGTLQYIGVKSYVAIGSTGSTCISIPAGVIIDQTGVNSNLAFPTSGSYCKTVDRTLLTGSITNVTSTPTNSTSLSFRVNWSKSAAGFTKEDVLVDTGNGTVTAVGSSPSTTMTISVTASIASGSLGEVCISIPAGKVNVSGDTAVVNQAVSQRCIFVDRKTPTISSVTSNNTEWTNSDVTVFVTAYDNDEYDKDIQYSFDDGSTWQSSNNKTYSQNQATPVKVRVKDSAGNVKAWATPITINKIDKSQVNFSIVTETVTASDATNGNVKVKVSIGSGDIGPSGLHSIVISIPDTSFSKTCSANEFCYTLAYTGAVDVSIAVKNNAGTRKTEVRTIEVNKMLKPLTGYVSNYIEKYIVEEYAEVLVGKNGQISTSGTNKRTSRVVIDSNNFALTIHGDRNNSPTIPLELIASALYGVGVNSNTTKVVIREAILYSSDETFDSTTRLATYKSPEDPYTNPIPVLANLLPLNSSCVNGAKSVCSRTDYLRMWIMINGMPQMPKIVTINTLDVTPKTTSPITALSNVEYGGIYEVQPVSFKDYGGNEIDAGQTVTTIEYNGEVVESIDTRKLGTYTITTIATDSAGVESFPLIRTVVIEDTTKPTISLIGKEVIRVHKGKVYLDEGVKVNDNVDGELVILSSDEVDYNKVGNYKIRYYYVDSSGNASDVLTRTIEVRYNFLPLIIAGASVTLIVGAYLIVALTKKKKRII